MIDLNEIQKIKQRFGIIGNNSQLNRNIEVAVQVAVTDLSVLITGENGSGKEFFPKIVHAYSTRKHGPYFAVNCGAIPQGTIDSELFGHEKGSFTDAKSDRKGYFEIADGGTLFLDEVGELPIQTQVRLLRVLETGEFIKVGSSKVQKTNVRVVAATNLDMQKAISEGRFREDLYYRLNMVEIHTPPLRERHEDIPLLFRKFAVDFSEKYQMPPIRLTEDATRLLQSYYWRGNIRQLKNVVNRISVIENDRNITALVLKNYLPDEEVNRTPILRSQVDANTAFVSDRELMYYNMVAQLKDKVDQLEAQIGKLNNSSTPHQPIAQAIPTVMPVSPIEKSNYETAEEVHDDEIKSAEVIEDVTTVDSMQTMEREMIRKALLHNNGSRKLAAMELQISERTLYRKIKEYELDKNN